MTINAATGVVSWAAAAAPGNYAVTVRATNGASPDATQTFTVAVAAAAVPVPALSATGGLALAVGLAAVGGLALVGRRRRRRGRRG
jgi:hypothetical protein